MMFAALLIVSVPPETPTGRWTNPSGSVTIEIAACGKAYCGTVVAASDKAKADAAKGGTKSLVGTQLLSDFAPSNHGRWKGRIFIPDLNRHPRADISLVDENTLKVRGCAIGRSLCKSQLWTRAD
ncbi:MAG: DUF2147 domain-containing protein [Sphingomicrobium sp.]